MLGLRLIYVSFITYAVSLHFNTCWLVCIIMLVADVLAPNMYQAISNHLADLTSTAVLHELNMLHLDHATDINSLRPRRDRRHFADGIFKCIFLNENELISLRISLRFVPKVRINNVSSLVQIMAWRRPGDKPLFEPMVVSLLTHICVTRPIYIYALVI